MSNEIFTVDDNNNAAVRTVSVKAGAVESNQPDIFTQDENGNAAVRVIGAGGGSIDENHVIIKSAEIPTASADVLGQMYCFDGETNNTYAHGYVYECVADTPEYTDSVTFEPATLSGTVVSAPANSLANLLATYVHDDITSIVSGTMTYDNAGDIWRFIGKDAEDNTIASFQIYTLDYEDAGFIFTGTPQDGDVVVFTCTITETISYSWERIDLQPVAKLGRYLSSWNCVTGLAGTNPPESPYEYTTGDYFIVSTVATVGGTNYKPNGSSYVTGQASTTVEISAVAVNDTYLYDGTSWTLLKTGSTVTSVNGEIGDVQIKTIDGNSIMGSGNLELSTYLPYPAGWTTNSTTKAFCDDIAADTTATGGKAYLGEVTLSDLPSSMVNGEIVVEIMSGTTSANKVIVLSLKSGNVAPYAWQYVYWNGGSNVSGWQTLGTSLPSQSGNAGKFLITNGTDASWDTTIQNRLNITLNSSSPEFIRITNQNNIVMQLYQFNTQSKPQFIFYWKSGYSQQRAVVFQGTSMYPNQNDETLGKDTNKWINVYTTKINNGADITVPTTGGTMVVATPPTTDGAYILKATVSSGVETYTWANAATVPSTMPTLAAASWSSNTQTVTVTGVTTSNIVFVAPAPASAADYAAAGIVCTAQGTDSLTFTCTQTPSNDITVNVVIMG